jgi:hypothetical protein
VRTPACLGFWPTAVRNDQDGNGERGTGVWRRALGVEDTVVESVGLELGWPRRGGARRGGPSQTYQCHCLSLTKRFAGDQLPLF